MKSAVVVIVLIAVVLMSVLVGSYLAHRQRKALFRYQRALGMQRHAESLESLAQVLNGITASPRVPSLLAEMAVTCYQKIRNDVPETPQIDRLLERANLLLRSLGSAHDSVPQICLTPSELTRAQRHISEAQRILRGEHRNGSLTLAQLDEYNEELMWSWLQLEVRSHLRLAELALEREDRFTAFSHYKQAQQRLSQSPLRPVERQAQLDSLAEILTDTLEAPDDDSRNLA